MSDQTEVRDLHTIAAADAASARLPEHVVLAPDGHTVHDLYQQVTGRPRHTRAAVKVSTFASFQHYLRRFSLDAVAVFCSPLEGRYRAVLDYHTAEGADACAHVCELAVARDPHLQGWVSAHGKQRAQRDFAAWLEQRLEDIVDPDAARLLEAVQHVQAVRNVEISSKVDLDNGDLIFSFVSETKGKGEMVLPSRLKLGLPVFDRGPGYAVDVRLRHEVTTDGDLFLWVELVNLESVVRDAAEELLGLVEGLVGPANVYQGTESTPSRHPF